MPDPKSAERPITDYRFFKQLCALPFVEAIYLYGSRARGDNKDDLADIDLAISCPKAEDRQWHQVLDIIQQADTLLKMDVVRLEKIQDMRLKGEIDRDKVALWTK